MKPLISILFTFFSFILYSQDTIQTITGKIHTDIAYVANQGEWIKIISTKGEVTRIQKEYVERVVLGTSIKDLNGWLSYTAPIAENTIVLKDGSRYVGVIVDSSNKSVSVILKGRKEPTQILRNEIDFMMSNDSLRKKDNNVIAQMAIEKTLPSTYFQRAGSFGIVSIVGILAGSITGIVGAVTGKPVVTYVGAGIGGAGFIFLIPAFANLRNGGWALREKGL